MSIIAFRRALRLKRLDRARARLRRRWREFRVWWVESRRPRTFLQIDWDSSKAAPTFPCWRVEDAQVLPDKKVRKATGAPIDHLFIQIVLFPKILIRAALTEHPNYPDRLPALLLSAAVFYGLFRWLAGWYHWFVISWQHWIAVST